MNQCWLEGSWMDKSLQGLLMFKTPEQLCCQRLWLWLLDTWGSFPSVCAQALFSCPARAPVLNEKVSSASFSSEMDWLL